MPFSRSNDDIVVPAEDMEALLWLVVAVLFCSVAANGPPVYVGPVDVLGGS